MNRFRKHSRRTLGIESLESRQLMAGDVSAWIFTSTGSLNIEGDDAANAVEVRGTGIPGEVILTPLTDAATGQLTRVNGSTQPVLLTGMTGRLNATMFGGNDEFYLKDLAVIGDGYIRGDSGADTIRVGAWVAYGTTGTGDVSFTGKLVVTEQYDNSVSDVDRVFMGRLTLGTRIEISTGFGDDFVEFYDVTANGPADHPYALLLRGDDGSDNFNIAYTTVYGNMKITTDAIQTGNDLVSMITSVVHGTAYIDVWHGYNTVALNANQFLNTLEIYHEIGDDTIRLTNTFCNKKVTITGFYTQANGNDAITIENNTISERIYIYSGGGNDSIVVRSNKIVTAAFYTVGGYDSMTVRNNIFYGHVDFVAGTEYDILYMSGNLFYSTYAYYEFESVQP
jgi:hypothetical protein